MDYPLIIIISIISLVALSYFVLLLSNYSNTNSTISCSSSPIIKREYVYDSYPFFWHNPFPMFYGYGYPRRFLWFGLFGMTMWMIMPIMMYDDSYYW